MTNQEHSGAHACDPNAPKVVVFVVLPSHEAIGALPVGLVSMQCIMIARSWCFLEVFTRLGRGKIETRIVAEALWSELVCVVAQRHRDSPLSKKTCIFSWP